MKIKVSHLKDGHHFISTYETPEELALANDARFTEAAEVRVDLEKRSRALYFKLAININGRFACDRCLDEFIMPLEGECRLIYSSDKAFADLDEDVRYITPDLPDIDLTADLREIILLAVPLKLLCRTECKGLCPSCGTNLNLEQCSCQAATLDPRWEKLRKIFEN